MATRANTRNRGGRNGLSTRSTTPRIEQTTREVSNTVQGTPSEEGVLHDNETEETTTQLPTQTEDLPPPPAPTAPAVTPTTNMDTEGMSEWQRALLTQMTLQQEQITLLQQTLQAQREQNELQRQQLAQDTQTPARAAHTGQEDWLDRVNRHHPPRFNGERDPMKLEEWFKAFNRMFNATKCPDEYRTDIAAYFLTGDADTWWQNLYPDIADSEEEYTWEDMQAGMTREFYPAFVRTQKRNEFLNLTQERSNLDVHQYYNKFRELMRFDVNNYRDEKELVEKFEDGLNGDIRNSFGGMRSTTLTSAYERAVYIENANIDSRRLHAKRRGERENVRGMRHRRDFNKRPRQFHQNRGHQRPNPP